MPELPEVQIVVDGLAKEGLVGRRIREARVYWARTIALSAVPEFRRRISGRQVLGLGRRGKYIEMQLDRGLYLLIHLRMTGRLHLTPAADRPNRHVQVALDLDDRRRLMFHDTRKFGRFFLTDDPGSVLGKLGPEPLSKGFSARRLAKLLGHRRRQVKSLLMDQSFLAGLGNIYVDEALWRSCIHPLRKACTLSDEEVRALHRAIRHVLRQGIRNAGTSLGSGFGNFASPNQSRGRNRAMLKVFRQDGRPCSRCGHTIRRMVVVQRGTHICPHCQRV